VTLTRPLADLRSSDAGEFGGKSANLGELMAAGIPVPDGFAIRATQSDPGSFPAELRAEIGERYSALGEPPVAVRSSAE